MDENVNPLYEDSKSLRKAARWSVRHVYPQGSRALHDILPISTKVRSFWDHDDLDPNAFLEAAGNGKIGFVWHLLDKGADFNCRDGNGSTALHLAVMSNHLAVMDILPNYGADANARDSSGRTPLHVAVRSDAVDSIKVLLKSRANVNCPDDSGTTTLHYACRSRLRHAGEVLQLLLDAGASVNARDHSGKTSLLLAVTMEYEQTEMILTLLFEHGAADLGSCKGENACTMSKLCANQRIYDMLLQHDKGNRAQKLETRQHCDCSGQTPRNGVGTHP